MSQILLEWRKHSYFPYELRFARLEVERVLGVKPTDTKGGLHVPAESFSVEQLRGLTYFARAIAPNGERIVPAQCAIEATAVRDASQKQATRYSAHGLHEYKGKFNPQVVRAVGNMLGLQPGDCVLDPFCGSGTTLLEAAHVGWSAVGTDLSPLAVRIANSKVHALRTAENRLEALSHAIREGLQPYAHCFSNEQLAAATVAGLPEDSGFTLADMEYLRRWFPEPVLVQIRLARQVLTDAIEDPKDLAVFEVILSNQLRRASLQDPADLRIRRRKDPNSNYPLLTWFIEAIALQVSRIRRARAAIGDIHGEQQAHWADARLANFVSLAHSGRSYDAVITSPPYATALPYIDTQRLSLVVLEHIAAKSLSGVERTFVGARDIASSDRRELERQIVDSSSALPAAVSDLCRNMLMAARDPGNGFRRKNMPSLIWRYFRDMASTLSNLRKALSASAPVALVVGENRTTLGGKTFRIDTPSLLVDVALHLGYRVLDDLAMDTYPRFGVHQRNAIREERLIVLERGD